MADFGEGGELLKVLYATLGRRITKLLVWAGAFVLILFLAQWGIQGVDWLIDRFDWATVSWNTLLSAIVSSLLALVTLVAFASASGLLIGFILRFGVDTLQRRKVERLANSLLVLLEQLKTIVPQEQMANVLSFIEQTENIRKPPLFIRILNIFFKPKKKREDKRGEYDGE